MTLRWGFFLKDSIIQVKYRSQCGNWTGCYEHISAGVWFSTSGACSPQVGWQTHSFLSAHFWPSSSSHQPTQAKHVLPESHTWLTSPNSKLNAHLHSFIPLFPCPWNWIPVFNLPCPSLQLFECCPSPCVFSTIHPMTSSTLSLSETHPLMWDVPASLFCFEPLSVCEHAAHCCFTRQWA